MSKITALLAAILLAFSFEAMAQSLEYDRVAVRTSEGLTLSTFVSGPGGSTGPLPALS